jgi:hypothetical protein
LTCGNAKAWPIKPRLEIALVSYSLDHIQHGAPGQRVVRGGIEPPTFRFSGGRSYQLSYLTSTGLREDQRRLAASPR